MDQLSPIVLFTYLRLETLKKTINALAANFYASESDLIIYSDGAKFTKDIERVNEIRTYLKTIQGFKSVKVHESTKNKGLASSIIHGVSSVLKIYPSAIVLEDDLLTSTNFLAFMNASLGRFKDVKNVYSISGYSFDFPNVPSNMDGYLLNRSWSWGWATWSDRWNEIDWQMNDYPQFISNKKEVSKFALLGSDVNKILSDQMQGKADSWYIRSTYHQFKIKGLAYYPCISKVNNEGFDSLATHNKGLKSRFETNFDTSEKRSFSFPDRIEINPIIQADFSTKMGLKNRILNRVKELLFT
jgi:hypothetical protein